MLKSLGLYEIKNLKVGSPINKKISGGQRKRLNIALELIREPSSAYLLMNRLPVFRRGTLKTSWIF